MDNIKLRFILLVLSYMKAQLIVAKKITVNRSYWKDFDRLEKDILNKLEEKN